MAESFGNKFTIVEVTADDFVRPRKRLWVAAAKPEQALTLVLVNLASRYDARSNISSKTRRTFGAPVSLLESWMQGQPDAGA